MPSLDDVIVYSTTVEEHIHHVHETLTVLEKAGVTLNISNCTFFSDKVDYVGHVVDRGSFISVTRIQSCYVPPSN